MNNIEHLHGDGGEQEDTCPACTGLHYIDDTELKKSISGLEALRLEMLTEHQKYCDGFVELDPSYDGDPCAGKKVPCAICWPDGVEHD